MGRDAELPRLQQAFEAAGRGHRQTVFVAGEPGIGKTAVIDAFVAELRRGQPVRVGASRIRARAVGIDDRIDALRMSQYIAVARHGS